MRRLGSVLMIVGAIGVVVGVLAAVAPALRSHDVAVSFRASSVGGPLIGGAMLLVTGRWVRRRSHKFV